MKLLVIAPVVPYPPDDGGRLVLYHLVRQLVERNVAVRYAAPRSRANDMEGFSRIVPVHLLDVDPRTTMQGALRYAFDPLPYRVMKYRASAAQEQLDRLMEREQFDLVLAETIYLAGYAQALKKKFGVPIILQQQNVESEIDRRFRDHARNPLVRMYASSQYEKAYRYEASVVQEFDLVMPITGEDDAALRVMAPGMRSVVVPAGVDTTAVRFAPRDHQEEQLLFFTNLDWLPNRDSLAFYLQDIVPRLRVRRPGLRTVIAGKSTNRYAHGDEERGTSVLGFVQDLNTLPSLASIAVVPLRIGSGVRIKILELMALGMAVVTTSAGIQGIKAVHDRHVVIADTPEAFAEQVEILLSSPQKVRELGTAARALVEKDYSWNSVGEIMYDSCLKVIRSHNPIAHAGPTPR